MKLLLRVITQLRFQNNSEKWIALIVILIGVGMSVLNLWDGFDSDSGFYLSMSLGEFDGINAPFRQRVLQPILAGGLNVILGYGVGHFIIAIGSLGALVSGIWWLLKKYHVPNIWAIAGFAGIWVPVLTTEIFLPDFLAAALFVAVLIFIQKKQWGAVTLLFCPLVMIRESYLIAGLILLVLMLRKKQFIDGILMFSSGLVGYLIAMWMSAGASNTHGLGGVAYLLMKMPFNFIKNMFGLPIWTNTLAEHFTLAPIWKMELPNWLQVGGINQIGLTAWQGDWMALNWLLVLCSFGLFNMLLLVNRKVLLQNDSNLFIRFVILYGGVTLVIAPLSGASVQRLYPYAWPLMAIAIPIFLSQLMAKESSQVQNRFLVSHIFLSLLPIIGLSEITMPLAGPALVVAICIIVWNWHFLKSLGIAIQDIDLFLDAGNPSSGSAANRISSN